MACCMPSNRTLSNIFKNSKTTNLAVNDGETVHFLVCNTKGNNYLSHCNEVVTPTDPVSVIQQYTDHTNNRYAEVNLNLASDASNIDQHANFIKQLRASILTMPLLEDSPFFRGVELSKLEIDQMEKLQRFFIPSFTSTSIDKDKAYDKNSMLIIKTGYMSRYGCSVTSDLSKYHSTEKEVLFCCYSAFILEKIEKVNGVNLVTLFLDEFGSSCDKL
eukprot:TRINITY_DN4440_c0_g1_i1.p1 TRINITY_DN4440_c0_g1~~TRINITY_DN4440_c0_g1_i1.p1  ORF type:complete len:217 (-),score=36.27 TRINITY_DN4440_c0_g1_i1:72-722(-)